ncbi:hypothetical protein L1987_74086 [Smallanthus sonchifolius]|uniref:Uncharacterized protein n=1 Tax=Smallanthus sonchifolius TaxID=185202 RepID=A0ACB9A2Q1_9ASTR|nr:hypothetical protein L1987_74086 [Smallanthus sonchifolius]
MGIFFTKIAFYFSFILFLLVGKVVSRHLQYNAAELVSDGVSDGAEDESVLRLNGMDSSEEQCKLMYGFLPCSTNIPSHIFLIVIYEYLLYHGESYAGGDGRIFRVLGKNFFVSSLSQLLDSLPDSLILLATGLWSSKEKAQEYVVTGAGLLAGSSILLLTILWGVCFICARTEFYVQPDSKEKNQARKLLTGSGLVTDAETCYHAKIMFFSLIPFVIILLPSLFGLSYSSEEYKIVLLVSLSASLICMISYFYYQHRDPRIWRRRLQYAEVEQKVEMHVPFYEVQALLLDRENHLMRKQTEMEKKLKNPEDSEKTMSKENFNEMFEKWMHEMQKLMDDPYSFDNMRTEYNQVVELLLEDKNKLIDQMLLMMEHALGHNLFTKEGTQDESAIDRFFERIDTDKDGSITGNELQIFIKKVNEKVMRVDEKIADMIMRHLDVDGNKNIDKHEFKSGLARWLASCNTQNRSQDNNQETDTYHRAEAKAKAEDTFKAIILLIVGIFMLTVLAEPLVESVRKFSESVNIEPFYVSFILVPLATNARTAIAAIRAANQKRHPTTSLTFSEVSPFLAHYIYHKVFLNNILGFSPPVDMAFFGRDPSCGHHLHNNGTSR